MRDALEKFYRFVEEPIRLGSRPILVLLVLPLILAFTAPLWNISMKAPQYPQGLSLDIYAHKVEGGNAGNDIQEINTLNHYTSRAMKLADVDTLNADRMAAFYQARFSNAADFTYFVVGAFTLNRLLIKAWFMDI